MLVSVIMITYNHSKQIKSAIEGVLNQKVNFDYELIVANDLSTDDTGKIVEELITNHSRGFRIKYLDRPVNLGPNHNFSEAFESAGGKFIALCEGDDFWTDPLKLQKQINFLEENSDYSSSFHEVDVIYPDKLVPFSIDKGVPSGRTVDLKAFLNTGRLIPTCSFVFRRDKVSLPPFFKDIKYGDFPLFCMVLLNSKAYYFPDSMASYRKDNVTSLTNSKDLFDPILIKADYIQFLVWLKKFANEEEGDLIDNKITEELNVIRTKVRMYKGSRIIKLRKLLENLINQ